jgi:hypothetical protein
LSSITDGDVRNCRYCDGDRGAITHADWIDRWHAPKHARCPTMRPSSVM